MSFAKFCQTNIFYLTGKRGVFTTNSGLTVAYVSGVENPTLNTECQITKDDIERVRNACVKSQEASFRGIDILLTSTWPANVTRFDEKMVGFRNYKDNDIDFNEFLKDHPEGSHLIAELAIQIKPRYHFFGNQSTKFGCHFTRAIALANVKNDQNQKWLFAMNLIPLPHMKDLELYTLTTNTTECPYNIKNENSVQQFFYDMNFQNETEKKFKRKNNKNTDFQHSNPKIMKVSQDDCWFCLASPKFEKHLVISVGEEVYLTLAKGGLVWNHAIILPVSHFRTYLEMSDSVYEEIEKYPFQLFKHYLFAIMVIIFETFFENLKYYSIDKQTPVFFDRNYKTPHHQIQVIPVPNDKLQNVKQLFMELAEKKGFSLMEIPVNAEIKNILQTKDAYFYVEIGNHRLIHVIKNYFPLQFAREVLAHPCILNAKDRIEWRNIKTTKEEEINYIEKFKNEYKTFDFTL
ncbi:hypothetical protein PGB90_010028 [Kerria lacca]